MFKKLLNKLLSFLFVGETVTNGSQTPDELSRVNGGELIDYAGSVKSFLRFLTGYERQAAFGASVTIPLLGLFKVRSTDKMEIAEKVVAPLTVANVVLSKDLEIPTVLHHGDVQVLLETYTQSAYDTSVYKSLLAKFQSFILEKIIEHKGTLEANLAGFDPVHKATGINFENIVKGNAYLDGIGAEDDSRALIVHSTREIDVMNIPEYKKTTYVTVSSETGGLKNFLWTFIVRFDAKDDAGTPMNKNLTFMVYKGSIAYAMTPIVRRPQIEGKFNKVLDITTVGATPLSVVQSVQNLTSQEYEEKVVPAYFTIEQ